MFTLYTALLEDIILHHKLNCVFYADDTQLYITCNSYASVLSSVESCVSDICSWMRGNLLILNESKIEVVHFSSRYKKSQRLSHVRIGDALINPYDTVRDLGVLFDQYGTMKPHVN